MERFGDMKNHEGYYDPTAGTAIRNVTTRISRGEIYQIDIPHATGHEMEKARPGIIVSCDALNQTSPCVNVVFCSTTDKRGDLPEHIVIRSTPVKSTALCEHISTVDKSRVLKRMGCCTKAELEAVGIGIMAGLGLDLNGLARSKEAPEEKAAPVDTPEEKTADSVAVDTKQLVRAEAELETYRRLYESLLDRMTGRASA